MRNENNANILIVDNDEGVVQAIRTRLESLGYNCTVAASGAQGLGEFEMGGIDLIISDLNMPCLNGIGFVRTIRATSQVPVIVVTGFEKEFASELDRLQNVTVLRKPFEASALIELVTAELAMRNMREAG